MRILLLIAAILTMFLTTLTSTGCAEMAMRQKERQMELVARDWSMTIRASQVVPVYPLNQDIQPGDVFLVNRTVADQSRRFRERGFLPTDVQIARLAPERYAEFYQSWRRPDDAVTRDEDTTKLVLPRDWPWEQFPAAGFPSYSFNVSNSGGLSIAVPVQAVPFALSITGAARATGSVTISEALTYGIDANSLYDQLVDAMKQGKLNNAVPPEGEGPWYLRVVTRVFAAKSFDVVLTANSTLGGGADVGFPQVVSDASGRPESGQSVDQINEQIKKIGASVDAAGLPLPGGSVRATFASGRTIGFREPLDAPIVVGYHGFDVAFDSNGNIGPIIPTFQVLDENTPPLSPTTITDRDSSYIALLDLLREAPIERASNALTTAANNSAGLKETYSLELSKRPNDPVGAWVAVTRSMANTDAGRRHLQGLVSRAIRETGE